MWYRITFILIISACLLGAILFFRWFIKKKGKTIWPTLILTILLTVAVFYLMAGLADWICGRDYLNNVFTSHNDGYPIPTPSTTGGGGGTSSWQNRLLR